MLGQHPLGSEPIYSTWAVAGQGIARPAPVTEGSAASEGVLVRSVGVSMTGSVASTGTVTKMTGKLLTASVDAAGTVARGISILLTGNVNTAGTLGRLLGRTITAVVPSNGVLIRILNGLLNLRGDDQSGPTIQGRDQSGSQP